MDGINTAETISLVEIQHIGGLTTFTELEVTESLDVSNLKNICKNIVFHVNIFELGQRNNQRKAFKRFQAKFKSFGVKYDFIGLYVSKSTSSRTNIYIK